MTIIGNVSKRKIILRGLIVLVVMVEILFDPIEIALGKFLLLTNHIRPQVGRLWVEEERDKTGSMEVAALSDSLTSPITVKNIQKLNELHGLLQTQHEVILTKENFLNMYKKLPPANAASIIAPLDLIEVSQNDSWQYVRIVYDEPSLGVYLLDVSHRVLLDAYPSSNIFDIKTDQIELSSILSHNPECQGRVISADIFYRAYNRLPRTMRTQIINNPYKLLQWGQDLLNVGISRYVINGAVEVVFEVKSVGDAQLHRFQANEMAVEYLINFINEETGTKIITPPIRKNLD